MVEYSYDDITLCFIVKTLCTLRETLYYFWSNHFLFCDVEPDLFHCSLTLTSHNKHASDLFCTPWLILICMVHTWRSQHMYISCFEHLLLVQLELFPCCKNSFWSVQRVKCAHFVDSMRLLRDTKIPSDANIMLRNPWNLQRKHTHTHTHTHIHKHEVAMDGFKLILILFLFPNNPLFTWY